ncbi:hypothetical protein ACFYTQ_19755 [Nocardia sp. NPDC004068]|uniref:hypothetical protein n=1 Tax=Nocardia sp. NPDC004068 TaxID=3364303 RepID=UPI003696DC3D
MTDDKPSAPTPLEALIKEAEAGHLRVRFNSDVRLNAEEFAYIDRDCAAFKDAIRQLQLIARNLAHQEHWGLGEDQDILPSARILVHRFRAKAGSVNGSGDAGDNNLYNILDQHYKIVDDLQQLHRTIAQKYIEADQEFAARYNEVSASMPPSKILPGLVQGPIQQPDGKWR